MKKLITTLLLFIGFTIQAQTFDFGCVDPQSVMIEECLRNNQGEYLSIPKKQPTDSRDFWLRYNGVQFLVHTVQRPTSFIDASVNTDFAAFYEYLVNSADVIVEDFMCPE